MSPRLAAFISWLALPIYIWQGLALRKSIDRLNPPLDQYVRPVEGKGEPLRLLLVGDSSAAGVGVDDIHDSLGGQLVKILSAKTGRPVQIRIAGCNSATASELRDYAVPNISPNINDENFTHVILNVGTNDAKNFHTGKRFCKDFGTLLYALTTRFPNAQIIWSSILDLSTISTLPKPLNHILGIRSREMARRGKILCQERGVEIPQGDWDPSVENFSTDGFHASPKGYREWAQVLAAHILKK